MYEQNYRLHSSEKCFGKHYNQQSIKDGLGDHLGNRADDVKQYKTLNKNVTKIQNLPSSRIKCYIELQRSPARAGNRIRSKLPGPKLPRSAAILAENTSAVIRIMIPPYPVIVTDMKRGSLLEVWR